MKFSMFKKGKPKEKNEQNIDDEDSVQVTDLEEELNNQTNTLLEKQKQLQSLSGDGTEETTVAPHGPIDELKIEPGDKVEAIKPEPADNAATAPEATEEIKVVEVKTQAVAVKKEEKPEAVPPPKEEKKDDLGGQSLNSLFQSEEEEENPLANLIKGLPDVSADELVKDLNEIKDIIKEWQKKS